MHHYSSNSVWQALLGAFFGGLWFFKGIKLWREKREIQNRPTSKIRSAAMGDVELCGTVSPIQTVKAPFSQMDCVYCTYKVDRKEKNSWKQVETGVVQTIFYIDDGSGQMLVNPEGAEYYGQEAFSVISFASDFVASPPIAAWVVAKRTSSFFDQNGTYRFREWLLCEKQTAFIEGTVSKVRHVVHGLEREENIVSQRKDGYFIISNFSEETLLSRFGWQVPLQIFGGLALLLGCLAYVVTMYPTLF